MRAVLQASRIVNPDLKRFVTLAMPRKGSLTLGCKVVARLIHEAVSELEGDRAFRPPGGAARTKAIAASNSGHTRRRDGR